jgi:histidinol-phosphate aminotransferase
MYPVIAAAHNVDSTAVPTTTDLVHDLDAMLSAIRENTKLVIIDNPNNPTGTYVPQAKVRKFLASVPHQVIVVMDEAYFEYATAEDYPNSLRLRDARERLVVLRTFAKAYGLAGFRVGYGVGPAQIIGYMNRLRAPFNVGVISQEAAIAGLSDQRHVERAVELNTRERERMAKELSTRGHGVFPSQTNFLFVDFGTSSAKLYDQLLDQGVIVRPIPGFETCLRITIGTERENDRLLSSLDKVLRR